MASTRQNVLERRRARIRAKIRGTATVPRLSVHTSNKHFYVQAIDDEKGKTVASSFDKKITDAAKLSRRERASAVGREIAGALLKEKIKKVVFDRGGKRYAGTIRILAEAARESGLSF